MAKKYPGLYLYFDWLKNLETLPLDVGMEIILNLYHFAQEKREPRPLSAPHYEIVQNMLMDQVKRSMDKSMAHRQAAKRSGPLPVVDIQGMTDEEVVAYLQSSDYYADEDPYEIVRLQRRMAEGSREYKRKYGQVNLTSRLEGT